MYYRILKRIEGGLDSKTKERYCKEFYRIQFRKFLFNKWQDAFLQKAGGPISPSFPLIYDTLEDAEKALSNKRYLDDLKPPSS